MKWVGYRFKSAAGVRERDDLERLPCVLAALMTD